MGLPGNGKTFLAAALAPLLDAVCFNIDDLNFSSENQIEQARRMGLLCDHIIDDGHYAIADFVCPTPETRKAFGEAFIIYMDTNESEDTENSFKAPLSPDYHITTQDAEFHAKILYEILKPHKEID